MLFIHNGALVNKERICLLKNGNMGKILKNGLTILVL